MADYYGGFGGDNCVETPQFTQTDYHVVILTQDEAVSLADFLEIHLIDDIRNDTDIDSLEWLANMISIYKKCKVRDDG